MRNSYAANARPRKREGLKRLILEVDLPFLAEIDGWGITSGHESRSAALRRLITFRTEMSRSARCAQSATKDVFQLG